MLKRVSRTFALTIPQLPSTLCKVVSNAYLLCRIVDTIEDEPGISAASKRYFCHKFVEVLDGAKNAARFSRQLSAALSSETPAAVIAASAAIAPSAVASAESNRPWRPSFQ